MRRLIRRLERVKPYDLHAHPMVFIGMCLAGCAAALYLMFSGSPQ